MQYVNRIVGGCIIAGHGSRQQPLWGFHPKKILGLSGPQCHCVAHKWLATRRHTTTSRHPPVCLPARERPRKHEEDGNRRATAGQFFVASLLPGSFAFDLRNSPLTATHNPICDGSGFFQFARLKSDRGQGGVNIPVAMDDGRPSRRALCPLWQSYRARSHPTTVRAWPGWTPTGVLVLSKPDCGCFWDPGG